jgi:hypothetical protein
VPAPTIPTRKAVIAPETSHVHAPIGSIRNLALAARLGGPFGARIASSASELARTAEVLDGVVSRFKLAV